MTLITGNTFAVKDQIKDMGGKWDAALKGWMVPDEKADQVRALVGGGERPRCAQQPGSRRAGLCKTCGCRINYGVYCGKCEYS